MESEESQFTQPLTEKQLETSHKMYINQQNYLKEHSDEVGKKSLWEVIAKFKPETDGIIQAIKHRWGETK